MLCSELSYFDCTGVFFMDHDFKGNDRPVGDQLAGHDQTFVCAERQLHGGEATELHAEFR